MRYERIIWITTINLRLKQESAIEPCLQNQLTSSNTSGRVKLKTGDWPGSKTVVGVGDGVEAIEERRGGGGDAKKRGEVTTTGEVGGDKATAWIGEVDAPVEEVDAGALAGKREGAGKKPSGLGIGLGNGALRDTLG